MSQVDKFNKRWGIKKTDEKVVNEASMKRDKENEGKVDPMPLLKESGLKEAAIVISSEGMDLFSKMFANSVSTVVDKALTDHQDKLIEQVDNIVTTRLSEVLEGLIAGMRKSAHPQIKAANVTEDQKEFLREMVKKAPSVVVPTREEAMQLYHTGDKVKELMDTDPATIVPEELKNISAEIFRNQGIKLEGVRADQVPQEPPSEKRKPFFPDEKDKKVEVGEDLAPKELKVNAKMAEENRKSYDRDDAVGVAVEFLRQSNEPQLAAKINKHLKTVGIEPYKNPTTFMNKVMKKEPRVQKAGFGTYNYVETNFKPVL